jgi:hypothetical protein
VFISVGIAGRYFILKNKMYMQNIYFVMINVKKKIIRKKLIIVGGEKRKGVSKIKAKQITYEKVKSSNFNNEKIGIVVEIEDGETATEVLEKAKKFVQRQFGEIDKDFPF